MLTQRYLLGGFLRSILCLCLVVSAFPTTQAASAQTRDPLRGFWAFEGNLLDSSSFGNHASDPSPRFGPGITGQALLRDGLELPIPIQPWFGNDGSLNLFDDAITLEAWVKSPDWRDGFRHIIDNVDGYALSILDGRLAMLGPEAWWTPVETADEDGTTLINPMLSVNAWHYVVGTYDHWTQRLYVDGQLVALRMTAAGVPAGQGSIGIGGWGGIGPGYLFNGAIDNLRVFAYARGISEIEYDFANPPGGDLPPQPARTPVILIPGFGGTELINTVNNSDATVWLNPGAVFLSRDDAFLDVLQLDPTGTGPLRSTPEYQSVRVNGVIRMVTAAVDVYDTFVTTMQDRALFAKFGAQPYQLGEVGNLPADPTNQMNHVVHYVHGQDFWLFPVDFRKDLSSQANRLDVLIQDVLSFTGAQQVSLVAHSQGGLIARAYISDPQRSARVSKLISLGTPYLGSTDTFQALRYGLNFFGWMSFGRFNLLKAKQLIQNWPGGLELLPANQAYFDIVAEATPLKKLHLGYFATNRDIVLSDNISQAPGLVTSWAEMHGILTANAIYDYWAVYRSPEYSGYYIVPSYNKTLINQAAAFQQTGITSWMNSSVDRTVIAGSGRCTKGWFLEQYVARNGQMVNPKVTVQPINGDGTVPLPSADMGAGLNSSVAGNARILYATGVEHLELPNVFAEHVVLLLNNQPLSLLGQNARPLTAQENTPTTCSTFTVYSPADIHVVNDIGQHTGINSDGDSDQDVPGSLFLRFSENQEIMVPSGVPYTVTIDGTGVGLFDLVWQDWSDSLPVRTIVYQDVPVTPDTEATLLTDSGSAPVLSVDTDGDGTPDIEVAPTSVIDDASVLQDSEPPTTTMQITGMPVDEGYLPGASLVLSASDGNDGSGVVKTVYSLDEGLTNIEYSSPVELASPGVWTVFAQSTDRMGNRESLPVSTTVKIVSPPAVVSIANGPLDPTSVESNVEIGAVFDGYASSAPYTSLIDWGDGAITAGQVQEAAGSGAIAASHTYANPGVYSVRVTLTDTFGVTSETTHEYVVVYDAQGGFVTGGGWIVSPAGAYTPAPTVSGKASFGFVSKYEHGANTPTGNTQFNFKAAGLNFQSTSYYWLVVAGKKAQFKGTGTINGQGDYEFMLTAIDGQISGGGGADKLRIKIWDRQTGGLVYDNQMQAADTSDPTTVIGGGSIVIHR